MGMQKDSFEKWCSKTLRKARMGEDMKKERSVP